MTLKIDQNNHPKSIWYWVKSERWWYLPYLQGEPARIAHNRWSVRLGGGTSVEVDFNQTASILFYGANDRTGSLPVQFLSEAADAQVSIIIHRNHVAKPAVFYAHATVDRDDSLTQQILHRQDAKKAAYIARTLVKWQWRGREWLGPVSIPNEKLTACRSVADVFTLESHAAREYWTLFFRKLGEEGVSRRSDHPINSALDATSHFLSGLTLRWVLFHGLSPAHGYLHTQTGYLALVYDLMELFRWWSEKAVFDAVEAGGLDDLTARSIERLKDAL